MGRVRKQYNIKELDDVMGRVSSKLKQLREKADISQMELSRRSKVSQSTINEIENRAATDLQFSTVCQLAKGLEVKFEELFSRTDMTLIDPDKRDFVRAVDDMEKSFRVMDRLRNRVK